MKKKFNIDILSFKKISNIENTWTSNDYKALLVLMEFEDGLESISDNDLREMCMMSLSDFAADEAAKYVLTHVLNGTLLEGKIDQIAHDLAENKLWEEYADLSLHQRFFDAYGLLREAFNGTFALPTGVKFQVKISSKQADYFEFFKPTVEPSLVRLLSAGMDENTILNRLYGEKIESDSFPEAKNILWEIKEISKSKTEATYEIISSELWFGELEDVDSFEALTHADSIDEED
jgi:hypothetical protein